MFENMSDLLKQIALGEDSVLELKIVEFKGDKVIGPHRDSMADELAAMANTASGTIVLGVDDKTREIRGIPVDEQTVPGTSLGDLNPKLWSRFRTVISPKGDHEFLEKMKLVTRDEDGDLKATVSGILMAWTHPNPSCPAHSFRLSVIGV